MKNMRLLLWAVAFFWGVASSFAQTTNFNQGDPKVPFGSNLSYNHGIMPTNLPTSGDFGRSQHAADQYNYWIDQFVEQCNDGSYRVKFTEADKTVSEGIAYGMLLSVYAADKVHFDGFYKFFDKSKNGNGLMHWMTDGCEGNARDNSATDAELDIAHALMIASEQWPGAAEDYKGLAKDLIGKIMLHEIDPTTKITWSGDHWKDLNILNPSYQSPAYYRQYAEFDKTATYASTWAEVAAASETLLGKNADATSGLISNWCDFSGTANASGPNNPYVGYGSDACRGPWRMATDVIWHGAEDTAAFAFGLCKKMSDWLAGHENNLRGQMTQSAGSPEDGLYSNGSYTTFALAVMAMDDSYQESLNKCYSFTAAMSHDNNYFNETVRTLSLFTLTGNFWKPGTSGQKTPPEILNAETNETGTEISITFTNPINTSSLGNTTDFVVAINGTDAGSAVTAIAADGANGVVLTVTEGVCVAGKAISISYNGSAIEAEGTGAKMEEITGVYVKNNLLGNSTLIDNCDDGNATNLLGGVWFTYNDADADDGEDNGHDGGQSTVTPLSTRTDPLPMLADGAEGSAKAVRIEFEHKAGDYDYGPFVGVGFSTGPDDKAVWDLTGTTGISFWHRGASVWFMVELTTITDSDLYKYKVAESATWQHITINWDDPLFAQDGNWGVDVEWEPEKVVKMQWQVQEADGAQETSGLKYLELDFLELNGLPPTDLVSFEVDEVEDDVVEEGADVVLYTSPTGSQVADTMLHLTYSPSDATYKEVLWTSANPAVATVRFDGYVTAVASGRVRMTAKSVVDESIVATCEVKVFGDEVLPETVVIDTPDKTTISVNEKLLLTAKINPTDVDDATILWTSSNLAVAVVDEGEVIGLTGGKVTIKAISQMDNSIYDEIEITVEAAANFVETLNIIEDEITVETGKSLGLARSIVPATAADTTLSWQSLDENFVTVTEKGVITGVKATTDPIMVIATATDQGTVKDTILVTVEDAVILATKIELNKEELVLLEGISEKLTATVTSTEGDVTDPSVEWASLDPDYVTVDADGTVKGIQATGGTPIEVKATTKDGSDLFVICYVTVEEASGDLVETVTVEDGDFELVRKGTKTLAVEVLPATAANTNYTITSLDTDIVTVDGDEITAIKAGTVQVVATADDASGKADTITVTVTPILVTDIIVSSAVTVLQDETKTVAFQVVPADADNTELEWSLTSGDDVLSINDNEFTGSATATGTATVVVSALGDGDKDVSKTITVTVTDQVVSVEGISIKETTTLAVGGKEKLAVTFTPEEPTNDAVVWTTDGTGHVSVDDFGNIEALTVGTTLVIATASDDANGTIADTCEVTVEAAKVTDIEITDLSLTVDSGKTVTIVAKAIPETAANTDLNYDVEDETIASVTSAGVVKGLKSGTTTVVVSSDEDPTVKKSVSIEVKAVNDNPVEDELITKIVLTETAIELIDGASADLAVDKFFPSDATNQTIEFSSTDKTVAEYVDGKVIAKGTGSAVIIAASADAGNAVATCVVTVLPDVTFVTELEVTNASMSLQVDGSEDISVTVIPSGASNSDYEFVSSDNNVVIVSSTGTVTAKASGQAYITVKALDGSGVQTIIPVLVSAASDTPLASSISISGASTSMKIGEVTPLTVTLTSSEGTPDQGYKWVVSDESVVKFSGDNLQAIAAGTAKITVIATDGSFVMKSKTITVQEAIVDADGIEAEVDVDKLVVGEYAFYTAGVTPSGATNQVYEITVDEDGIVEIDEERGSIKAVGEGTVIVTFESKDGGYEETVEITVTKPEEVAVMDDAILKNAIDLAEKMPDLSGKDASLEFTRAQRALNKAISDAKEALDEAENQDDLNVAAADLFAAIDDYNELLLGLDVDAAALGETVVFPSPATDIVTVAGSGVIASVSAVATDGSSVVLASDVNTTSVTVSVEDLSTGLYTIVVVYIDGSSETLSLSKL